MQRFKLEPTWTDASADVSLINEKAHNSQRIDTFHTPGKLVPIPLKQAAERRSSTPTPILDGQEAQYGQRSLDILHGLHEDAIRCVREELHSSLGQLRLELKSDVEHSLRAQMTLSVRELHKSLQSAVSELREGAAVGPNSGQASAQNSNSYDHFGVLESIQRGQQELTEIVRGHLLLMHTRDEGRADERPDDKDSASTEIQVLLQKLVSEVNGAFSSMEEALKQSMSLMEDLRQADKSDAIVQKQESMLKDILFIKDTLRVERDAAHHASQVSASEAAHSAVLEELRQLRHHVQEYGRAGHAGAAQVHVHTASMTGQLQALKDSMASLLEHSRAERETSLQIEFPQDVVSDIRQLKSSAALRCEQTEQLRAITEVKTGVEQLKDVKAGVEHLKECVDVQRGKTEKQLAVQGNFINDAAIKLQEIKESVQQTTLGLSECKDVLQQAPSQLDIADAVSKTFDQMSGKFHEECRQLYLKPTFHISLPEDAMQDIKETKTCVRDEFQALHSEWKSLSKDVEWQKQAVGHMALTANDHLTKLEQDVQQVGQDLRAVEQTVASRVLGELQHVQDIFILLETNFLSALRGQVEKATTAFSSSVSLMHSSLKSELETLLKPLQLAQSGHGHPGDESSLSASSQGKLCMPWRWESLSVVAIVELLLLMSSALLEVGDPLRFGLALLAAAGPWLLNVMCGVLFYLQHAEAVSEFVDRHYVHALVLFGLSTLRPDCLRLLGGRVEAVSEVPRTLEESMLERAVEKRTAKLRHQCDEMKRLANSDAKKADESKEVRTEEKGSEANGRIMISKGPPSSSAAQASTPAPALSPAISPPPKQGFPASSSSQGVAPLPGSDWQAQPRPLPRLAPQGSHQMAPLSGVPNSPQHQRLRPVPPANNPAELHGMRPGTAGRQAPWNQPLGKASSSSNSAFQLGQDQASRNPMADRAFSAAHFRIAGQDPAPWSPMAPKASSAANFPMQLGQGQAPRPPIAGQASSAVNFPMQLDQGQAPWVPMAGKASSVASPPAQPSQSQGVLTPLMPTLPGQAPGDVPAPVAEKDAADGAGALEEVRPEPVQRPPCLLCGLAPGAAQPRIHSSYKSFCSRAALTAALYSDLPRILAALWLIGVPDFSEAPGSEGSVLLRVVIVLISLANIVLAVASCWRGVNQEGLGNHDGFPPLLDVPEPDVEAAASSITVKWTAALPPDAKSMPDEYLCELQPAADRGGAPPASIKRVAARAVADATGCCCDFKDLPPSTSFVVLFAPARGGLLLARPSRIPVRTLERPEQRRPPALVLKGSGPTWATLGWAIEPREHEEAELRLKLRSATAERTEVASVVPHTLQALVPATEYVVDVSLLHAPEVGISKLTFTTGADDTGDTSNAASASAITAVMKEVWQLREMQSGVPGLIQEGLASLQERSQGNLEKSCGAIIAEVQQMQSGGGKPVGVDFAALLQHVEGLQERWGAKMETKFHDVVSGLKSIEETSRQQKLDLSPVIEELRQREQRGVKVDLAVDLSPVLTELEKLQKGCLTREAVEELQAAYAAGLQASLNSVREEFRKIHAGGEQFLNVDFSKLLAELKKMEV
eukprot:TRINITY_DN38742_c0_g1_i1.p1 TRINITY_DN38742_c0_g1~~TRINITY_DN38742_c0_g1_i1.p1  ORF type:complete len:1574 (-),score=385.79 TRINITY_DN38742_c0_g1_i1:54-4775(-)